MAETTYRPVGVTTASRNDFKSMIYQRLVLISIAIFILVGCSLCDKKEMLRITSPDNKVDAILMQINCGATTDYAYKIYITPKGGSVDKIDPVFVADKTEGITIEWTASKYLTIKYKHARIFKFTNLWQARDVDNFNYVVTVREMPFSEG